MSCVPALELHVVLRAADGTVCSRERWCWAAVPPARQVLHRVARATLLARRGGLTLQLENASPELRALIGWTGLDDALRL